MDSISQLGTVQAGEGFVMVWGVGSLHDIMRSLIRLDTTVTGDKYAITSLVPMKKGEIVLFLFQDVADTSGRWFHC
ncbi:hypothetical protein TNCV_3413821 [Trichonephila clavipes]|uniref:Uncharacterized protein n=1 Tax=Trichonephila clavipes TaxID=2585209 RepID=A0A8X6RPC7_TRICX|nr:hypothetical protein TNCV_3413821 [Trichonephila clavipes]